MPPQNEEPYLSSDPAISHSPLNKVSKNLLIICVIAIIVVIGAVVYKNKNITPQESVGQPVQQNEDLGDYKIVDGVVHYKDKLIFRHDGFTGIETLVDVDTETFQYLGGAWARDKDYVYSFGYLDDSFNPQTIRVLPGYAIGYTLNPQTIIVYNENSLLGVIDDPDRDTFKQVGRYGVSISTNNIYSDARKLDLPIDASTFTHIGGPYYKDSSHIYYDGFYVDEGHSSGLGIIDADLTTFVYKDFNFAIDNRGLYRFGKKILDNIDTNSFSILEGSPPIIKDRSGVYYATWLDYEGEKYVLADGVSPERFEYVGRCASVEKSTAWYYKNSDNIFVYGTKLASVNIDVTSFRYLGSYDNEDGMPFSTSYGVDKNNVYYGCGGVVEGADPRTFQPIGEGYAKDDKNVYFNGEKIANANPKDCISVESCKALLK